MNRRHPLLSDPRCGIIVLSLVFLTGFAILLGKLYFEQIRRGSDHQERISRQSLRRIRVPARRGKIFYADHKIQADNSAGCAIVFYPEEMRRPGRGSRKRTVEYIRDAAAAVSAVLGRENPLGDVKKIERHLNLSPGLPIMLFRGLSTEEVSPVLELSRLYDGIGFEEDESRQYPFGRLASHLIGYVGLEQPRSAPDHGDFFYYVPDLIGRAGLEKAFDSFDESGATGLRGKPGSKLVRVDSLGFIRNEQISSVEPRDGNHLILTIDARAQHLAETLLAGRRGAFVMLDASDGAVLAMASSPAGDLRYFTPRLTTEYYSMLLRNPDRPLINRAINGTYTPGSILKPLVAMALLNKGIDPHEKVNCDGKAVIGDSAIRCAARSGHGPVDMFEALEKSCNVYFIEKALVAGRAAIAEVLDSASIGKRTGFELADSRGQAPTEEYKRRYYRSGWNRFDTAQLGIGQGIILLTPLQAALYAAAIGNGGTVFDPYIVDRLADQRGGVLWKRKPVAISRLATKPEYLDMVKKGMFDVVNSPGGSGRLAKNRAIELSGKTGSAEVGSRENRVKNTWFIAFGTVADKTYAVAMVVEEGVSGGTSCAPLVGEFFEKYLATE